VARQQRNCALLAFLAAISMAAGVAWAAPRSKAIRAEFVRLNPCPANGATSGPCPGYQVDHIEALVCGGRDELANLQWLKVAEHREKTRVEVKLCRARSGPAAPKP
jgi:hypothetical protein